MSVTCSILHEVMSSGDDHREKKSRELKPRPHRPRMMIEVSGPFSSGLLLPLLLLSTSRQMIWYFFFFFFFFCFSAFVFVTPAISHNATCSGDINSDVCASIWSLVKHSSHFIYRNITLFICLMYLLLKLIWNYYWYTHMFTQEQAGKK